MDVDGPDGVVGEDELLEVDHGAEDVRRQSHEVIVRQVQLLQRAQVSEFKEKVEKKFKTLNSKQNPR